MSDVNSDAQRRKAHERLINIANVSKRLHTALARAHANLQAVSARSRLDKIVIASRTILAKSLENDPSLDPRLELWLCSKEPDMCLHILTDMERLIVIDRSRTSWWGKVSSADKIDEASKLFNDRQDYFHFLLTPEVWNWETDSPPRLGTAPGVVPRVSRSDVMLVQTSNGIAEEQKDETVDLEKLDSVLNWLNGLDCNEKHADVVFLRQRDTCMWLPQTDQYNVWRNSEDSFLWLQGKAGAGKSVLAASIIEAIRKTLQDGESIVFFYCDFRNERTTSATGIMGSILSQLLRKLRNGTGRGLIQLVDDMVNGRTDGTLVLKHDHIASLVSRTARQFSRQPLIVLDALDECNDVENLLGALRKLTEIGGIRLLVTSRPLAIINDIFYDLPSISMDQMAYAVSADIRLHVTREVEGDRRLRILERELKMEIYATLQRGADGMFRWIQCQIDTLKKSATRRDLLEALNSLPSGLEETYERILRAIDPQSSGGKIAMRALVWLVAALRPLQLVEILEALSIDLKGRRLDRGIAPIHGLALLEVLGSLVVYGEETDIVNLSHFTVKEYLVGSLSRANLPMYHINLQVAHVQVLQLCMGYIAALIKHQPLSEADGASSQSLPLLRYVFFHGFDHLKHVESGNAVVLDDMIALRLDIQRHPVGWAHIMKLTYSSLRLSVAWLTPEHDFIIYVLITSLPEPSLCAFLGRSPFKAFGGTSPLIYATYFGRIEHAKTLLSRGVSVNSTGLDVESPRQVSPLEVAFYRGHRSLFDLFLAHWMATVPPRLFSAVFDGQCSKYDPHIVAKLLKCDEFSEWAAEGQHNKLLLRVFDQNQYRIVDSTEEDLLSVLRRFVQVGCDLAAPDSLQLVLRVIWNAVSRRYPAVLWYLWSQNVPIPSRALLSQETTLVQELAFQGLDVNAVMTNGDFAFQRALGQCKHGSSCWTTDCNLCSAFRQVSDCRHCIPMNILFVGRTGAGKSSLINMITCVPQFEGLLPRVTQVSGYISRTTSYATLLGKLPFHIWDTPGFDKTSDGQNIRSNINDWFHQVSLSRDLKTDHLHPTLPIIQVVWCMHASEIDDPVAWQQFRDIYEECCRRKSLPIIVLNQTMSTQSSSDWEMSCENRLRQLDLSAGFPRVLTSVRRHEGIPSPEYKEDYRALKQLIHQHVRSLLRSFINQELGGRFYPCGWVIQDSLALAGPGVVCGHNVRISDFAKHIHLHHDVAGQRNKTTMCCWVDCGRHMQREYMLRHIQAQHLLQKYVCPVCSKQFSHQYTTVKHFERHFSPVQ